MKEKVGLPYLGKLVGKTVTVFKGGPESRTGVLLEVKNDYLVLQPEDEERYVYYPFTHVKSVIDNSKNGASSINGQTAEDAKHPNFPDTFLEAANSLQLSAVQVNGEGPASRKGYLIDAKSEFIVLGTEKEGLVFYRMDHIKSITGVEAEEAGSLPKVSFGGNHSFLDLLGLHLYNWTTINGGPDKVEGVLVEVNDTYSVLVKNEEIIYVKNYSIHFIAQKVKDASKEEEKNSQSNEKNSQSNEKISQSYAKNSQSNKRRINSNVKRMLIENLTRSSMIQNRN